MSEHAFELVSLPVGKLLPTIKHCISADINLIVMGAPGIGKTQIAQQAAATLNMQYAEMLLAGRDVGDVMLPYVNPDMSGLSFHYNPALPIVGNPRFDGPTVLNIDEFSGAQRLMQNFLLKVLDERKIGEAKLRDDVWIMGTGNRAWDLAHVEQLSAALGNRATFVTVEPDLQAFLHYGVANNYHPIVLSWVRFNEDNLSHFDREAFLAGDPAFCSPRANERLSNILKERDASTMDDDIFRNLCAGTIGKVQGIKFTGFVKIAADMPDLQALLSGVRQPTPKDPAVLYATLVGITQKITRANLQHAVNYIERLAPEWQQMFITATTEAKPEVIPNPVWGTFIAKASN